MPFSFPIPRLSCLCSLFWWMSHQKWSASSHVAQQLGHSMILGSTRTSSLGSRFAWQACSPTQVLPHRTHPRPRSFTNSPIEPSHQLSLEEPPRLCLPRVRKRNPLSTISVHFFLSLGERRAKQQDRAAPLAPFPDQHCSLSTRLTSRRCRRGAGRGVRPHVTSS